jgi:hypothetical protein
MYPQRVDVGRAFIPQPGHVRNSDEFIDFSLSQLATFGTSLAQTIGQNIPHPPQMGHGRYGSPRIIVRVFKYVVSARRFRGEFVELLSSDVR